MQRHVMVDGKVRTDKTYPAGMKRQSSSFARFVPSSLGRKAFLS
ncbi:40S ribosomal protein S4 [Trichinella patagoniensis]|uniref:40S ribosomal protein S4 n=1 Tax=Trichinella patagoniensis TaxID=990121 RepID=A0A0V0XZG2_9BILA|nr:40S ribosomal protein S4 [Trichinella patagoniensis]